MSSDIKIFSHPIRQLFHSREQQEQQVLVPRQRVLRQEQREQQVLVPQEQLLAELLVLPEQGQLQAPPLWQGPGFPRLQGQLLRGCLE
jgi:hypothetical protein